MCSSSALLSEVRRQLIPIFISEGFSQVPLTKEESKSELAKAFPFGRLKRDRSGELEVVEIQFDLHGKLSFVLNLGIVPSSGVNLPWGEHVKKEDAGALGIELKIKRIRPR